MPLYSPDFLARRLARPVAVMGGAVSGRGAISLLSKLGAGTVVYDRDDTPFTAEAARGHSLVVFSPGFTLHHPWLEAARKSGCICLAEIDFASLYWRGRTIAVTGTNGKTTLTEFLTHALRVSGRGAVAAGNIGLPFSRAVADEDGGAQDMTAVCEVSSFQAEQLGYFSADSLLWTNFAEDHLERHSSMQSYFLAKWELVLRTPPGRVLVGTSAARHAAGFGVALPPGAAVETEGQPPDARLAGTPFATYPQRENFILASAWWRAQGYDGSDLLEAARTFRVGRHRLALVARADGISFWNDSKATNFHAVEAAVAGFARPVVLIAGGRSKGGDVAGFARRIAPRLSHAVLIGETGPPLAAALRDLGVACTECGSLDDAVRAAASAVRGEGDVLLSPGFSSFDMFRNYEERGDRFERAVAGLAAAGV